MSGLKGATLFLFERGQDGRRGHYDAEAEGTEAVACDSQGDSKRAYAGRSDRAYLLERAPDTKDSEANTAGR